LTVADILSRRRADLTGNVRFLFQPAEEVMGGAIPMVEAGVMDGVDNIIGLHLFSTFPLGRVGVRNGSVFASADKLTIKITGKGGHAAMPHEATDPIVIGSYMVTALQTLISRETSPFSPSVISITKIEAGTAFNIIPNEATLMGTMRTYSLEHREKLVRRTTELATGLAASFGATCSVEFDETFCPPCVNDPTIADAVRRAATATVGPEGVDDSEAVLTTGADDMGFFLNAVPGCYFIVGANDPAKDAVFPHHHPRFNINEDALPIATEVLTRTALEYLS
jgi:amidohydrolase